jgi:predicted HTH domain antitoxin
MPEQRQVTQLNIRIPKALARELEELAHAEHLEKIDMARRLLWEGVARRKQERALQLYAEGKVGKSRAAELAGLSLWELMELVEQQGVRWDYSLAEAKAELKEVFKLAQRSERGAASSRRQG